MATHWVTRIAFSCRCSVRCSGDLGPDRFGCLTALVEAYWRIETVHKIGSYICFNSSQCGLEPRRFREITRYIENAGGSPEIGFVLPNMKVLRNCREIGFLRKYTQTVGRMLGVPACRSCAGPPGPAFLDRGDSRAQRAQSRGTTPPRKLALFRNTSVPLQNQQLVVSVRKSRGRFVPGNWVRSVTTLDKSKQRVNWIRSYRFE
jgi:hypothetical protein